MLHIVKDKCNGVFSWWIICLSISTIIGLHLMSWQPCWRKASKRISLVISSYCVWSVFSSNMAARLRFLTLIAAECRLTTIWCMMMFSETNSQYQSTSTHWLPDWKVWKLRAGDFKNVLCISLICAFRIFSRFRTAFDVWHRPGYKIWRLFKFSSILLSFKTRHWPFILTSENSNLKRRQIL
jgi:hypothetical protein